MKKQCKFIKEDKARCKSMLAMDDGFCMVHSPTAKKVKVDVNLANKEKSKIAKEFKLPSQQPLKQVREFCIDCCETRKDIQFCASVDCALWFLRFGTKPKAYVRTNGKNHAQLFNKENFKTGGRYDPEIEMEKISL